MNTTEFLQKVKTSITFPSYQARLQDTDILSLANEEQELNLAMLLSTLRQEFCTYKQVIEVEADTEYVSIPERAMGRVVRMVEAYTDANTEPVQLTRLELEEKNAFSGSINGTPYALYIQDDEIYFLPKPNQAIYLNFYYEMMLGDLVPTTKTATITAVGVDTVTVAKVPTNITVGTLIDITKHVPGFRPKVIDAEVLDISGTVITLDGFDADNPITGVSVGNVLSEAKKTSILQMPRELTTVLIKYTAKRMLQAQNLDDKKLDETIQTAERRVRSVCSPRFTSSSPSIINRNGLLRGRSYGARNRSMNLT